MANQPRWDKVKQIFLEAADLPPAEREAYLKRACAGDSDLEQQVRELLAEHNEGAESRLFSRPRITTLQPGQTLAGRFRIARFIGRGGMGEVYKADDLELGGAVALKIVKPDLADDPEFLVRFRREVQLARQVTHPNVCRVFDVGRDGDRVFFTMEMLEGQSLSECLRTAGKLTTAEALPLARQMAEGLAALHALNIVHRDFKPGNVMLTPSSTGMRAVIGDFGLARALAGSETGVSRSNTVAGTPDYMAPEQLLGKNPTPAADLFAFGVVLYEMVTGVRPFRGGQAIENAVQRMTEQPTPPRRHQPDLPSNWESAILRCLAREPQDRPESAPAVVAELAGEAPSRRPKAVNRRRLRWIAAGACFFLLLLAAFRFLPRFTGQSGGMGQQVVVLPFKVLGNEPELRVFADGLMETITSRMSQYEGTNVHLNVVAASEVRQQAVKSAADVKTKFGASTAVEGSLQAQGNRVRLLLTVIDTNQMRQRGTVMVEEQRSNAVSLQDAAVTKLANALNLSVQPKVARELQQMNPVAPGAEEYYLQARGYLQRSDNMPSVESAITLAQRALSLDSGYALAHSALGLAYRNKYDLTRDPKWMDLALASGRKAVELNPGLAEPHVSMGRIHMSTGRNEEALADFEKALAIDERSSEAFQGLAGAYAALKQFDKAEATYLKAISLRPGDWNGYRHLGLFYYQRGEYGKALEQYERVTSLAPDNALGYVNLGVMTYLKGDVARARQNWQRALELDPNRIATLTNLAKLESDHGDQAKAIELWNRALKINPRSHRIWRSLAGAYKRKNDTPAMKSALEQSIKLLEAELLVNPKDAPLYAWLAHDRAMNGEPGSDALLAKALALARESPDVLTTAAETWEMTGKDDEAVDALNKAVAAGYSFDNIKRSRTLGRFASRITQKKAK